MTIDGERTRADRYEPLPPDRARVWGKFGRWEQTYFPNVVGLVLDDVRLDYARLRLPYRPELRTSPGGEVVAEGWMTYRVIVPEAEPGTTREDGS